MGRAASAADELQTALLGCQNADGGVGARAGLPSATEATALATLALGRRGGGAAHAAMLRWLRAERLPRGGWPVVAGATEASWASALAVMAMASSPSDRPLAVEGADWLLAQRGRRVGDGRGLLARVLIALQPHVVDVDDSLIGWPWRPETFSWVEPTAYALLALRLVGVGGAVADERIAMGDALLLDRRCPDGGWNYGNSRVLGEALWGYPDTTALALLALRWHEPPPPDLAASLTALEGMVERTRSGLALALAALALAAYGRDASALREEIAGRFGRTRFLGDARATAFGLLALTDGPPPFTEAARA